MPKTFREWNPEQALLFPPSVDDFLPPGHLVYFVRDLVRETLDLSEIRSSYEGDLRGFPPYDPAMMVALLLYAYSRGLYSSRSIERACTERVDFLALTARQTPDHATIARFRRRHLEALPGLFVQVLTLCREAGLVSLGHVALDGTKVKANASKHKAMSYKRLCEEEERLKEEVEALLAKAQEADAAEDDEFGSGRGGDELPDDLADKKKRLETIQRAKKAVEERAREKHRLKEEERRHRMIEEGKDPDAPRRGPKHKHPPGTPKPTDQENFTDPESRILKRSRNEGFLQGYNGQAAVDADHQVIVAESLDANQNDEHALVPILEQIESNCAGATPKELSADSGYASERNLREIEEHGTEGYVAIGRQRHGTASATRDRPPPPGTRARAMWAKLRRAGHRSRYRLRKVVVEPVFGQMKHARGFVRFHLRGLAGARGEWRLLCITHNLLKLAARTA